MGVSRKLEWQARQFLIHFRAQAIDGALRYTSHYILLNVHEYRTNHVQSKQDQQDCCNIVKINFRTRYVPKFRDQAIKKFGSCQSKYFWTNNVEHGTNDRSNKHDQ